MDFINIGISGFLILLALLLKWNPNLIAGYKYLPEKKKQQFPINLMALGFILLGIVNLVIYFLLSNSTYHKYASWSFLFVISVGTVILSWVMQQKLK